MSVVVTDQGFAGDSAKEPIFDIDTSTQVNVLQDCLTQTRVHIHAENFSDGRIFTLARQLRLIGFTGVAWQMTHIVSSSAPSTSAMHFRPT